MYGMQKVRKAVYGVGATLLLLPAVVSAQWQLSTTGTATGGLPTGGANGVSGLIMKFMQWLLYILGFLAVIAFVISGILYLTSAGDDEKIEKAKEAMIYAIVGVIVALLGLIVMNAVTQWFTGNSATF